MEWPDLVFAVKYGDIDEVRRLLRKGVNVNGKDQHGYAALHYCAERGIEEVAGVLLSAPNLKIDIRTPFITTPLFIAAQYNNFKLFKMLLSRGADPNAKVMFGQTALHWITREGKFIYIKQLIKYGADVNKLDCFGMSPLRIHLHATMNIKITKLLVKNGADINETRFEQTSIVRIALYRWRQDKLVNLRYLVWHGANVNGVDVLRETALHWAARVSALAIVRLLIIKYRADISAKNIFGHTPLDIALLYGNIETIETIRELAKKEEESQMRHLGL